MVDNVDNIYKVPKAQWKKWDYQARTLFNYVYGCMIDSQHMFSHPKAAVQHQEYWKTTAWNTAWIVADGINID